MLVTNHVLSGAVLGAGPLAGRPVAALLAGFGSHFALDRVRHWGDPRYEVFLRAAVPDGLAGLAAIGAVTAAARRSPRRSGWLLASVLAGMAGAAAPDLDKPSRLFFGRSPWPAALDAWHGRIQNESPRRLPQEVAVAAGLSLVVALLLRRRP